VDGIRARVVALSLRDNMRKLISGALAALVLIALPAMALGSAGTTKGVVPAADALLDGATRTLTVGADIFIGDKVTTGPKGQVEILFDDNTKLVVGPHTTLAIDDYMLRNNGDPGKLVVDVLSGSFRFATGDSAKDRYEINTPTGTIGVRGTWFDGFIDIDGITRILHYEGIVRFKAKKSKNWTELHDLCTLGQISDTATILGNTQDMTNQIRNQLRGEFPYADNQSKLHRPFWYLPSYDCLHRKPDVPQEGPHNHGPKPDPVVTPPGDPIFLRRFCLSHVC
jgi:hypothetical protein